ncbi:hypothetical protein [Klenkia terrae]|jgi:hypothetical protein|uniref:Secreted protein n=1 Tax=Klenkia terrae TaxID=1052259 RepID=A0ABU8EAU0_9ACTN|nr:hypothetical protein [Klenkia terrae]SSC25107.1 Hypothetical protein KLENKIAIHU_3731 [Klenkia terrae]
MWLFLTRRLRTWLLLTVAAPLVAKVLQRAGTSLERKNGPTSLSRGLRKGGEFLDSRRRGAKRDARRR